MRIVRIILILSTCLVASACASGPKFADVQASFPKVAEGQGRVYFYRTGLMGTAVQPSIEVNGEKVGSCVPRGVFYKDFAPGDYSASVETEVERKLTFSVVGSEEKYIRCYITMGVLIGHGNLELVDPATARKQIQNLSFTKE